jgi:hypothetical protein
MSYFGVWRAFSRRLQASEDSGILPADEEASHFSYLGGGYGNEATSEAAPVLPIRREKQVRQPMRRSMIGL